MIKEELMGKFHQNMNNTVVIPTVGLGSRMGFLTQNLNKALLPYNNKPIISHIIDQCPDDTHFIILLGYLSNQVKDFLDITYPEKNITFVNVNDWTSPSSGTAYSLLQSKNYIKSPFWYIPCDTYYCQNIFSDKLNEDTYFIKYVSQENSHLYLMFNTENDFITDKSFKITKGPEWKAFTGVMYIKNYIDFFDDLGQLKENEFIYVIKTGSKVKYLDSWLDFGDPINYQNHLSKSQKFDFSKKDELTFFCNNKVIKWWLASDIATKKIKKINEKSSNIYPDNCKQIGNFIAYDFFDGHTLYVKNNPTVFDGLLNWLFENVWTQSSENIEKECSDFYKNKSLGRVEKFLKKYPNLPDIKFVDNIPVKNYQYYLNRIDWNYLIKNNLPGNIHGDLQFDNIIINKSDEFKIIDWRQEFADNVLVGDIYYDLAKLSGGFIINYSDIKNHNFNIEIDGDSVFLSVPNIDYVDIYQKKLKEFILKQNWDYEKVKYLVPIIFWNMSPLHTAPFDIFLWYLGIKLFQQIENDKIL